MPSADCFRVWRWRGASEGLVVYRYIGGSDPEADLVLGISGAISDPSLIPKILISYGTAAYGLHARRFNYLFHDTHVLIHKVTQTVGAGTTNAPRGMWTMPAGD